jgi:glycine/D-amino acid oxidase-like deaminating enzyme
MNVVVYEMAPGLGYGSSGYSTGFLRAYYSFDETMHLALDGISAYHNWAEVVNFNNGDLPQLLSTILFP